MITIRCQQCNALLRMADHLAGKKIRCPKCQAISTVVAQITTQAPPLTDGENPDRRPSIAPATTRDELPRKTEPEPSEPLVERARPPQREPEPCRDEPRRDWDEPMPSRQRGSTYNFKWISLALALLLAAGGGFLAHYLLSEPQAPVAKDTPRTDGDEKDGDRDPRGKGKDKDKQPGKGKEPDGGVDNGKEGDQKDNARPSFPSKKDAARVVARLKELAAELPNVQRSKETSDFMLFLVHASVGDEDEAFKIVKPLLPQQSAFLHFAVQKGQLRTGQDAAARESARSLVALLERFGNEPPRGKDANEFAGIATMAALACARVGDQPGIKKALLHRSLTPAVANRQDGVPVVDPSLRRHVAQQVVDLQMERGDHAGAVKTIELLPAEERADLLYSLLGIRIVAPGHMHTHPGPGKPLAPEIYRKILAETTKKMKGEDRDFDLARDVERLAELRCLIGLCRQGQEGAAADHVIALPSTQIDRQGLLSAICTVEAQNGKTAAAVEHARRGGYLLLAAELALRAGNPKDAARDLGIVELALEEKSTISLPQRIRLQRQLALLRFVNDEPEKGNLALKRGFELAETWRKNLNAGFFDGPKFDPKFDGKIKMERFDWGNFDPATLDGVLGELERTKIAAAKMRLGLGRPMAEIVQVAESEQGTKARDALADLWAHLGAAQWRAGNKDVARVSFDKAVDVVPKQLVPGLMQQATDLNQVLWLRLDAGDIEGVLAVLAKGEAIDRADTVLEKVAMLQARKGDLAGALNTIRRVEADLLRHISCLLGVADVQAEKGDLDGAFRTFLDNVRGIEPSTTFAGSLLQKAADQGRLDLVLRHLNTSDPRLLRQLAAPFVKAKKPAAARRIVERGLERWLARGQRDLNPEDAHIFGGLLHLLAEHDSAAVKELLPLTKDPILWAQFGDIKKAIELTKRRDGRKGPDFGEIPLEIDFVIVQAMREVAAEIVPRADFQDLFDPLNRNPPPQPAPKTLEIDPVTQLFEERASVFGNHVAPMGPPREPCLDQKAIERLLGGKGKDNAKPLDPAKQAELKKKADEELGNHAEEATLAAEVFRKEKYAERVKTQPKDPPDLKLTGPDEKGNWTLSGDSSFLQALPICVRKDITKTRPQFRA